MTLQAMKKYNYYHHLHFDDTLDEVSLIRIVLIHWSNYSFDTA